MPQTARTLSDAGSDALPVAAAAATTVSTGPERASARPWKHAAAWLAFLGPFFFLSYGLANWWTARLPQVASFAFGWERQMPFLPWTILPYMSIDLFYAASLFLCANRQELDVHAKRLLAATLISVTGFFLFPLRFGFTHPPVDGFNGMLFTMLAGFDKPFNQAPSLHISLLLLLWVRYARHVRGALRWALHVWFLLIGMSVFTTYQHHFIDGIAGAIVGVVCLYLFPEPPGTWTPLRGTHRVAAVRLARRYLGGSAACAALGIVAGGWAWMLLWPAAALLLVGLAYCGLGVDIFQKEGGRVSPAARLLLAPYQAGAWLSSRWFTRKLAHSAEVTPGVWIGRAPGRADWNRFDPRSVLDLTAEFPAGAAARARRYRCVPMLDLVVPSLSQLRSAVAALDALHEDAPVLVHCALGYSRSAIVIAAWLLHRSLAASPAEAVARVRMARPGIVVSEAALSILGEFHHG